MCTSHCLGRHHDMATFPVMPPSIYPTVFAPTALVVDRPQYFLLPLECSEPQLHLILGVWLWTTERSFTSWPTGACWRRPSPRTIDHEYFKAGGLHPRERGHALNNLKLTSLVPQMAIKVSTKERFPPQLFSASECMIYSGF